MDGSTARMCCAFDLKATLFGLSQVEVPLLYYFPDADSVAASQDRARAFVYEVRDDPDNSSRQMVEIVVDCGREFTFSDLHVDIDGEKLTITGERYVSTVSSSLSWRPTRPAIPPRSVNEYQL